MEPPHINGNSTNGHAAPTPAPNGVNGATSPPSEQGTKIFVGGISGRTNAQMLRLYFNAFGVVVDATVPIDNDTKRHRGFGFVKFRDAESVDRVLQHKEHMGHLLDDKIIDPKIAVPKNDPTLQAKPAQRKAHTESGEPQPNKMFIGGVDGSTSVEDVRAYFEKMGEVWEVELKWDYKTGRHKGFGFVTFADEDCVKAAVDVRYHKIGLKKVECKPARPKAELDAEKAQKVQQQSVQPHSQLNATAQQFVPMQQQHLGIVQPPAAAADLAQVYENINALVAQLQAVAGAGNGLLQHQGGLIGQHYQGAGPAWTPAVSFAGAVGGDISGYGLQPTPPPTPQQCQDQWLTTFGGSQNWLPPLPPAVNSHHAMPAANGFGVSPQMFQLPTNGTNHTNAINSQASSEFVGSPMTIGTWQPQMM